MIKLKHTYNTDYSSNAPVHYEPLPHPKNRLVLLIPFPDIGKVLPNEKLSHGLFQNESAMP